MLNTFDKWKLITSILQEIPTLFPSPIVVKIQFYLKELNPPIPWAENMPFIRGNVVRTKVTCLGWGIEA
jgi:hypothetical protein